MLHRIRAQVAEAAIACVYPSRPCCLNRICLLILLINLEFSVWWTILRLFYFCFQTRYQSSFIIIAGLSINALSKWCRIWDCVTTIILHKRNTCVLVCFGQCSTKFQTQISISCFLTFFLQSVINTAMVAVSKT